MSTQKKQSVPKKQPLRGRNNVYKRGNVWVVAMEGPKDATTGKRQKMWLRKRFRTRGEAEAARDKMRADMDGRINVSPEKITVGELMRRYTEHRRAIGKLGTRQYETHGYYQNSAAPIAGMRLRDVHKLHVQALIPKILKENSRTWAHHVGAYLKSAGKWAVSVDLLSRNVFDIEWPSRNKPKVEPISGDEFEKILDAIRKRAADGERWVLPVVLGMDCGMRRGEMAALPWRCVDFDNARIVVRQAFTETKSEGIVLKPTKSEDVRIIPMTAQVLALLRERRKQHLEEKLRHGADYDPQGDEFVFTDEFGRAYRPQKYSEVFRQARDRAKVRKSLHGTRHSFVSELLAEKVEVGTVSALAGHSSPSFTLSVYGHLLEGQKEAAIAALERRRSEQKAKRRKEAS